VLNNVLFIFSTSGKLSLQVVKENQILQKGDRRIDVDNECTTLADVNIFAGDQIIVRDSQIHENRNIAGMLYGTGTLLSLSYIYSSILE